VLITRSTRRDKQAIKELLDLRGYEDEPDLDGGIAFIARQGPVVGCVRLVEVAPQTLVIDDVFVREDFREQGVGRRLMQAAMNSRGGTMFLCCHENRLRFYGHLGFSPLPIEQCPEPVVDYWKKIDDYPTAPGHEHFYLKAR
jgi:GNAT superfamily N-acetyltransferase